MRAGFTLIEVLIAGALGAVVVGLSIDQVIAYFRVQQTLMTRVELRNELQAAETLIAADLRGAVRIAPVDAGYIAITPLDTDGDGQIGPNDRMVLADWQVKANPLSGQTQLLVQRATVPAFDLNTDGAQIAPLLIDSPAHVVAQRVTALAIASGGDNLARLRLTGVQAAPHQPPIRIMLSELVARRSLPVLSLLEPPAASGAVR